MRFIVIIFLTFLLQPVFAQDGKLLQKQLVQIMLDYPNKFKNLEKKDDPFHLKFRITGTQEDALILEFDNKKHINANLSIPHSDQEAKDLFEKWVTLINSIDLNGAGLVAADCEPGLFGLYCKEWRFDNSGNNIDPGYLTFKIEISIIKINAAFAAALKIGNL